MEWWEYAYLALAFLLLILTVFLGMAWATNRPPFGNRRD